MKQMRVQGIREDFEIAKVAFGTGSALKNLSKEAFFALFDVYAAQGGNVLDTAPGYCGGRSERYIGEWMRARNNRDRVFISTKACHAFPGEKSRLTEKDMMEDLALSLYQLGTDRVDLFWLHNDDPSVPVEQIIDAANAVAEMGKIRALGCSNWTVPRLEEANAYAARCGLHGFWANQIQMSLARPNPAYLRRYNCLALDEAAYRWHLENGVAVFAFSALSQGFFPVAAEQGIDALPESTAENFLNQDNEQRLARVKMYMERHGTGPLAPVIGYITGNRLPAAALMSTTRPENLRAILQAAETDVTAEEADWLRNG